MQIENHRIEKNSFNWELFKTVFMLEISGNHSQSSSKTDIIIRSHYVKVPVLHSWEDKTGQTQKHYIQKNVQKFNRICRTHRAYVANFRDMEIEPGERTNPASFVVGFVKR